MLNHMLDQLARHGLVDIYADIEGDLETGTHHINALLRRPSC